MSKSLCCCCFSLIPQLATIFQIKTYKYIFLKSVCDATTVLFKIVYYCMFNQTFFLHLISTLSNIRYTAGTDPFFQRFTSVTTPQHCMMSSVAMSPNTSVCTMVCLISSQLFLTHQHSNALKRIFHFIALPHLLALYPTCDFRRGLKKCRFVNP